MSVRAIETVNRATDPLAAADELQALADVLYMVSESGSAVLDGTTEVMARMICERVQVVRSAIRGKSC